MLALDFLLFGNGHGMKKPFWDGAMYWLVDTEQKDRTGRNGRLYRWIGGLGAQLESHEWRMPKPGTTRRLAGYRFRIFHARRRWLRVECSWALVDSPKDFAQVDAFRAHLRRETHS